MSRCIEGLPPGGLLARFLIIQYYIRRQNAIVTIDKKNYLFCRPHLCNFLYYIIYKSVRHTQTIRPYFVHQRKTAFLGKVIDYVFILTRLGIITLGALYPHFVFLYGCNYSYFRPKIAIYSLKKLEYS